MKFAITHYLAVDLVIAVIFCIFGAYIVLNREKVIDALLASNKTFWKGIGVNYNEPTAAFLTRIMIPVMGVVFCCAGILLLIKSFQYLLKK